MRVHKFHTAEWSGAKRRKTKGTRDRRGRCEILAKINSIISCPYIACRGSIRKKMGTHKIVEEVGTGRF